jgi:hypothetical protein
LITVAAVLFVVVVVLIVFSLFFLWDHRNHLERTA